MNRRPRAQLEEKYCTRYAFFDFSRRIVTLSSSGLPMPNPLFLDFAGRSAPGVPGIVSRSDYDE